MIISHSSPSAPQRINNERVQQIRGGFYYTPKQATFQTDDLSTDLVLGRVIKLLTIRALGRPEADFVWRDANDINHTFTSDEFFDFFIQLDEFVEGRMMESWQKKANL